MSTIVKLSWTCDKDVAPFNLYRSYTEFDINSLPEPFATNVTNTYHTFVEPQKQLTYYLVSNGTYQSEVYKHDPFSVSFPYSLPVINNDTSGGLTGWTVTEGTLAQRSGYFYGIGATLAFYQDVVLPQSYLNYLEIKELYVDISYLYGGWASDSDKGQTGITFIGASSNIISTVWTPLETVYYETKETFLKRRIFEKVPQGTVKIRIEGKGVRTSGTNLDAYWTDFVLQLKDIVEDDIAYEYNLKSLQPVAYYKLDDESNNSNALDYSVNGLHASYTPNQGSSHLFKQTALRKGSSGSMGFNVGQSTYSGGTPNCITPADPKLYNLTKGNFTLCFWAKRDGDSVYYHTIIQCAAPSSGLETNFRIIGNMQLQIEENSRALGIPGLAQGESAFICFVYDVNNQLYYAYKNNVKYTGTYIANTGGGRAVSTYFPANYSWNYYGFKGYMSDVAFFNKALTDQEVLKLYQSGNLNA